jgi:hypothetical protein
MILTHTKPVVLNGIHIADTMFGHRFVRVNLLTRVLKVAPVEGGGEHQATSRRLRGGGGVLTTKGGVLTRQEYPPQDLERPAGRCILTP